jgi:hypothetical protein
MKSSFFSSIFYVEEDTSWLASLNKFSDDYIKEALENNKIFFFNNKDFGLSHHSGPLTNDSNFYKFSEFVLKRSFSFLAGAPCLASPRRNRFAEAADTGQPESPYRTCQIHAQSVACSPFLFQ